MAEPILVDWSLVSETIYDGGLRRATVHQYVAIYNADLANYRQTVLTAFEQVENYLAEVRILSQQIQQQQQAVASDKQPWTWKWPAMKPGSIPISTL